MKKLIIMTAVLLVSCTDDVYVIDNCIIEPDNGGQRVTCGSESVTIPDQTPIKAVIDPCGDGPGHDEVVLVMEGNYYIAWYSNLGLTILQENTRYVTTDKQRCKFKIINGILELL